MSEYTLHHGDCLDILPTLAENHFDSIVTDPPYGISFMGKAWDHGVPSVLIWREVFRVLKPGGYLLAFAGTRTQHRMATNIEDAGFEIRDMIGWMYGSGFPKSHNISKALDKMAGAEREVVGLDPIAAAKSNKRPSGEMNARYRNSEAANDNGATITAPATPAAIKWDGWGTALKPAFEPITVARKPLSESTVAANVLKWGTGGINVDGCRVGTEGARNNGSKPRADGYQKNEIYGKRLPTEKQDYGVGRFPANLIHDGSDEVLALFPDSKSTGGDGSGFGGNPAMFQSSGRAIVSDRNGNGLGFGDSGSAARFFYCAKASKQDRDAGMGGFEKTQIRRHSGGEYSHNSGSTNSSKNGAHSRNNHPTVKPTDLMRYLVRLVTPKGGKTCDPFCGSGSTGRGAMLEGFDFTGIDLDAHNIAISKARIDEALTTAKNKRGEFTPTAKEKASAQMSIFGGDEA